MIKHHETIVVTGANGLVGSAVIGHLRNEMYTCVVPCIRRAVNLLDREATESWFSLVKPAYVFHSAATVYGLGGNMANQAKAIFDNTTINTNVIQACHRADVKKLTVMGTNAIYPASAALPYRVEDIFNGRTHDGEAGYGYAKRHMLAMLEAYEQSYGLRYSYLVSGNIYGPRDRFDPVNGHVLPSIIRKFADAKKSGGHVEIWGDGSARRDFLYSMDLARIVEMAMDPLVNDRVFNTGFSEEPVSIVSAVALLCGITGVKFDRVHFDISKPTGRPYCASDLSTLRRLGFTPSFSLEQGLRKTWEWYIQNSVN